MDEEQNGNINDTMEEKDNSGKKQAAANAAKKGVNAAKKAGNAAKAAGKVAKSTPSLIAFFSTPVGWIILGFIVALLAIISIAGTVSFFTTMPGIMHEKIANFFNDTIPNLYATSEEEAIIKVDKNQQLKLANYIDDLGYDLKGFGFLDNFKREKNENAKDINNKGDIVDITPSANNYLYAYILASERTYSLDDKSRDTFLEGTKKTLKRFFLPGFKWREIVQSLLPGVEAVQKGMISIEVDDVSTGLDSLEIDKENKSLVIHRYHPEWGSVTNMDIWEWDLEGWIGRYGKPLELSLALHLSTMAPDFAYNFCVDDQLQTVVHLGLNDLNYHADYKFKGKDGEEHATEDDIHETAREILRERQIKEDISLFENESDINPGGQPKYSDTYDYIVPHSIFKNNSSYDLIKINNGDLQKSLDIDGNSRPIYWENATNESILDCHLAGDRFITVYNVSDEEREGWEGHFERGDYEDYIANGGEIKITVECLSLDSIERIMRYDRLKDENKNRCAWQAEKSFNWYISNSAGYTVDELIRFYKEKYGNTDCFKFNGLNLYLTEFSRDEYQYESIFENFKAYFSQDGQWDYDPGSIGYKRDDLIAVQKAFNEDYEIGMQKFNEICKETQAKLKKWGLSEDEVLNLDKYIDDLQHEVKTYQPYIRYVDHHWYKDIYFDASDYKGNDENIRNIDIEDIYEITNEDEFEQEYDPNKESVEAYEANKAIHEFNENGGETVANLWFTKEDNSQIYEQIAQPGIAKNEAWHWKVKNWIMYGYYFIYDGTEDTAKKIDTARDLLANNTDFDSRDPLLGVDGTSAEIDSDEIDRRAEKYNAFIKEHFPKSYNIRKLKKIKFEKESSLAAFSMLENMHTLDSEYVYRDLKEFLIELGYFKRSDFEKIETKVLEWVIQGYNPVEWPNKKYERIDAEYGVYIFSKENAKKAIEIRKQQNDKNEDKEFGFEAGTNVIAPGNGKVIEVKDDSITIKFTTPLSVRGMTMEISGIVVDGATIGDKVGKGQIIGKTTTENVHLIMRDEKKAILDNIEDYMKTPNYKKVKRSSLGTLQDLVEFIWRWEGFSDADPNDGDYYTVVYPAGDIPTIGHGMTQYTIDAWYELGYGNYYEDAFVRNKPVPARIVDEVSAKVIENAFELIVAWGDDNDITGWGTDQYAAITSLYYNGFHGEDNKVFRILQYYGEGKNDAAKAEWLDCYNRGGFAYGHQRRRATELEIFYEGNYNADPDWAFRKYYVNGE